MVEEAHSEDPEEVLVVVVEEADHSEDQDLLLHPEEVLAGEAVHLEDQDHHLHPEEVSAEEAHSEDRDHLLQGEYSHRDTADLTLEDSTEDIEDLSEFGLIIIEDTGSHCFTVLVIHIFHSF